MVMEDLRAAEGIDAVKKRPIFFIYFLAVLYLFIFPLYQILLSYTGVL